MNISVVGIEAYTFVEYFYGLSVLSIVAVILQIFIYIYIHIGKNAALFKFGFFATALFFYIQEIQNLQRNSFLKGNNIVLVPQ